MLAVSVFLLPAAAQSTDEALLATCEARVARLTTKLGNRKGDLVSCNAKVETCTTPCGMHELKVMHEKEVYCVSDERGAVSCYPPHAPC
eukprot:scaffold87046_cov30-Attheya_sp.AAC.3